MNDAVDTSTPRIRMRVLMTVLLVTAFFLAPRMAFADVDGQYDFANGCSVYWSSATYTTCDQCTTYVEECHLDCYVCSGSDNTDNQLTNCNTFCGHMNALCHHDGPCSI